MNKQTTFSIISVEQAQTGTKKKEFPAVMDKDSMAAIRHRVVQGSVSLPFCQRRFIFI